MVEINLLPRNLRRRSETNWWRIASVAVPTIAVASIAILQYGAISENNRLTSERDQLKLEVETLKPYVRDQRTLTAQRAELDKIASVDKAVRSDNRPWSRDIAGFVEALQASGARVSLTQMEATHLAAPAAGAAGAPTPDNGYEGKNVTSELAISGEAASVADIVRFVRMFETSPNYGIQLAGFQARTNGQDDTQRTYTFNARIGVVTPVAAVDSSGSATTNTAASTGSAQSTGQGGNNAR